MITQPAVPRGIALVAHDSCKQDMVDWAFTAQPHEPDVRALLRLAVLANIPVACNRATADFVISSPLLGDGAHAARSLSAEPGPVLAAV